MREIVRRAGVGPATLYRHFPTKQMLATEAFSDQACAYRAIVDEGIADPIAARASCCAHSLYLRPASPLLVVHGRERCGCPARKPGGLGVGGMLVRSGIMHARSV